MLSRGFCAGNRVARWMSSSHTIPNIAYNQALPAAVASSLPLASRRYLSSNGSNKNNSTTVEPEKVEYVHPLSQIVLEHLQCKRSDWIQRQGLECGLDIHRDGTFELKFPTPSSKDPSNTKNDRIWTSYEADEKKHYLTVQKGSIVGRFMLQDNMMPAWHSDKRSIPERICDAVDQMIEKIDTLDSSSSQQQQSSSTKQS